MRLKFDKTLCTGCSACQMACLDQRDIECAAGQRPLRFVELRETAGGMSWVCVGCVHCGACMRACPAGAITRDEGSGFVLQDPDKCTGCGACVSACPLGVMSVRPSTGKAEKCDGCLARISAGLLPACVHTCPIGALTLVKD